MCWNDGMVWWLALQIAPELDVNKLDACERWTCASALLGVHFAVVTAVLTVLDLWAPIWWRHRLLKSTKMAPVITFGRIMQMLPIIFRNYVVAALYTWFLWNIRIAVSFDRPELQRWLSADLPGRLWVPVGFAQLLVMHGLSQIWFWSAHRFVHSHATIYKVVHAAHHVYSEPFALTAIDCSIWEMMLLNMPAVMFPLLIVQPPLPIQCIWMILAASHVPLTHSGHYLANGYAADAYHAIHHRECRYNFGSAVLDKIFGTYKEDS
jgi:sterol desaturase/sphingolipid hydroxylase (fatty acid hydroxylase superfamily)